MSDQEITEGLDRLQSEPPDDSPRADEKEIEDLMRKPELAYLEHVLLPLWQPCSLGHYIKANLILDFFTARYTSVALDFDLAAMQLGAYRCYIPELDC